MFPTFTQHATLICCVNVRNTFPDKRAYLGIHTLHVYSFVGFFFSNYVFNTFVLVCMKSYVDILHQIAQKCEWSCSREGGGTICFLVVDRIYLAKQVLL